MRLIRSFRYALKGISNAFREEPNLRIHFLAIVMVCAMGFYFQIKKWEWCVLTLVSSLVVSLELINSAIENMTDLLTIEQKPLAGKIKDISAGAVLIAAAGAMIVGIIIFKNYV